MNYASVEQVSIEWIKSMIGTDTAVATKLPSQRNNDGSTSWTSFVTVSNVGGITVYGVPFNNQLVQIDCYSVATNARTPKWQLAHAIATSIEQACFNRDALGTLDMSNYDLYDVNVFGINLQSQTRRIINDPSDFARIKLEILICYKHVV